MINLSQLERIKNELKKYPELEKEVTDTIGQFYKELTGRDYQSIVSASKDLVVLTSDINSLTEKISKFSEALKKDLVRMYNFITKFVNTHINLSKLIQKFDTIKVYIKSFYDNLKNLTGNFVSILSNIAPTFAYMLGLANEFADTYSKFLRIGIGFDQVNEQLVTLISQYGLTLNEIVSLSKENFSVAKGIGLNETANLITRLRQSDDSLYVFGLRTSMLSKFTIEYLQTLRILEGKNVETNEKTEKRITNLIHEMSRFSTLTNTNITEMMNKVKKNVEDPSIRISYRLIPEESARQLDILSTFLPEFVNAITTTIITGSVGFSDQYDFLTRANLLQFVQEVAEMAKRGNLDASKVILQLKQRIPELKARGEILFKQGLTDIASKVSQFEMQLQKVNETNKNVTETTENFVPEMLKMTETTRAEIISEYSKGMTQIINQLNESGFEKLAIGAKEALIKSLQSISTFAPDVIAETAENSFKIVDKLTEMIVSSVKRLGNLFSTETILAGALTGALLYKFRGATSSIANTLFPHTIKFFRNIIGNIISSISSNITFFKIYQIVNSAISPIFNTMKNIIISLLRYARVGITAFQQARNLVSRIGGPLAGALSREVKGVTAGAGVAGRAISKILRPGPLTAIIEGLGLYDTYNELYEKYSRGEITQEQLKEELSRKTGEAIGAVAGTTAGTALGVAGASLFGVGGLIGGSIGATVGYFGGAYLGEYIGEKVYEDILANQIEKEISDRMQKEVLIHKSYDEMKNEADQIKKELDTIKQNFELELKKLTEMYNIELQKAKEATKVSNIGR